MKKRPRSIIAISCVFWSIALVSAWVGTKAPSRGILTTNGVLTSAWLPSLMAFVVGCGIWSLRIWGYWAFVAAAVWFVGATLLDFFRDTSFFVYVSVAGSCMTLAVMYYFVQKHLAAPYYNPRFRDVAYRYKIQIASELALGGERRAADILDISQTGCFLKVPGRLRIGEVLCLHLRHGRLATPVMARVVRKSRNPDGYGLMFLDLEKIERSRLQQILTEISHEYYDSMTQETA